MVKSKPYLIIAVACFIVILTISASALIFQEKTLSEKDFLLEVDMDKNVFSVGEKISFTASILNRSGRDVNISSNGEMPCVFFHNINDTIIHVESARLANQIFKANEKITRVFEHEHSDAGTYVLDAHYRIVVNDIAIQNKLGDIIIEVK